MNADEHRSLAPMVPVGAPSPALRAPQRPSRRLLTSGAAQTIHKIVQSQVMLKNLPTLVNLPT